MAYTQEQIEALDPEEQAAYWKAEGYQAAQQQDSEWMAWLTELSQNSGASLSDLMEARSVMEAGEIAIRHVQDQALAKAAATVEEPTPTEEPAQEEKPEPRKLGTEELSGPELVRLGIKDPAGYKKYLRQFESK